MQDSEAHRAPTERPVYSSESCRAAAAARGREKKAASCMKLSTLSSSYR
jgi:hypothetical protein